MEDDSGVIGAPLMQAKSYRHTPPSQMHCRCISPTMMCRKGPENWGFMLHIFLCSLWQKQFFFVSRWHRCTVVAVCKAKKVSQRSSSSWTASDSWRQSSGSPHLCRFSHSVHSECRLRCIFQVPVFTYRRSLMKQKLTFGVACPTLISIRQDLCPTVQDTKKVCRTLP